ncbi:Hypothetical predicted protein [Pelobates cultripes]|uniref:Uncharacterized protein n=1 Tax=Pelobates cultripes TaxID=61616 RepID=A0AAD1W0N2_PELCU|nr:Hypothetical predicted protein [Pelobates cultripes]
MWRQAREVNETNMAALHGGCSDFSEDFSGEEYMPAPKLGKQTQPTNTNPDTAPVTISVLTQLLADHHKELHNDIAALRGDLKGLTTRLNTLESATETNTETFGNSDNTCKISNGNKSYMNTAWRSKKMPGNRII